MELSADSLKVLESAARKKEDRAHRMDLWG